MCRLVVVFEWCNPPVNWQAQRVLAHTAEPPTQGLADLSSAPQCHDSSSHTFTQRSGGRL